MFLNQPWLEKGPNGKLVSRPPTWREMAHRFLVSDTFIQIGIIGAIAALFVTLIICVNATEENRSTAVEEARATLAAELSEDGIPLYEGDAYIELTAYTDPLHPHDPTLQIFEIVGIESTDEADICYLVDEDGYTSTLTSTRKNLGLAPTWHPSLKPGTSEYDVNPKYEIVARCFLSGDFSVRYVSDATD